MPDDRIVLDDVRALTKAALPLSRRGFFITSPGTGYALATGPVDAQVLVITDSQGLTAGQIKIPVADGQIPGYRAKPARGTNHPVVLVCQDAFGVHAQIQDVCRRLAKQGYCAVAPALYARQGDTSTSMSMPEIGAIVGKVPDAQVMADFDAIVRWAASDGNDVQRLAITGFCWGGRIVWMYAAHNQSVKAGVAWYGTVVSPNKNDMTPNHPIDVVSRINAPVLGLYGAADRLIPVPTVEQMQAALRAAGKKSEFVVYPDAPHAFFADFRPDLYRKEAAEDGWKRLLAWFRQNGVAASAG